MEEQLITFETAKLAKEKGFLIFTGDWYNKIKELKYIDYPGDEGLNDYMEYKEDKDGNISEYAEDYYFAPPQSLLQKWLREKHNIIISVRPHFYNINAPYNIKYEYVIFVHSDGREFDTYEEALEQGLLEALNSIKI